jgi:uncharacterized protein YbjT (DUF2867 family)
MRVLVIGATGKTGDQLVRQLLEANHTVSVFVRTSDKLGDLASRVTIIQGDARNSEALDRALSGQEAVLSAFGPRSFGKDDLQEVHLTNLVTAMERQTVHRYIGLSAWGAGDSIGSASFGMKLATKTLLKNLYADKNRGEAVIISSKLDYTNVRPGRLADGPALGNVLATTDGKNISKTINRADVAAFMIKQIDDTTWLRKSPIIGYALT